MKNKLSFILPFFLLVFIGSYMFFKQADVPKNELNEEEIIETMIPENFIEFYMKFHLDTLFQRQHINFPIKQKADGSSWAKEEWIYHKPFNNNAGEFVQDFRFLNGLVFEIIQDKRGMFKMEKRYVASNDSYNLIYYSVENAFERNDEWQDEQ